MNKWLKAAINFGFTFLLIVIAFCLLCSWLACSLACLLLSCRISCRFVGVYQMRSKELARCFFRVKLRRAFKKWKHEGRPVRNSNALVYGRD